MGILDGLLGGGGGLLGGGGGGIGGMLGGLPIVGGLLGGGGGDPAAVGGTYVAPGSYPQQSFSGGPWPTMPGMPSGNPQAQHFNGNLADPGQAETFYSQHQGDWTKPGEAQGWWDQNKGKFGAGVADQYWNGVAGKAGPPPKVTNNAQGAYDQFQNSAPADTGAYYDNASRKAQAMTERAYASRGMRGSSAEMGQLGEDETNIRAAQAQADASYGLQRGALAGNLASGADVSSARGAGSDLSWLTGLGNLSLGTQGQDLQSLLGAAGINQNLDAFGLSGLNAGMTGAIGANNALTTRGQNFLDNNIGAANASAAPQMAAYMAMLQNDQGLQQAAINASMGYATNAANQVTQGRSESEAGLKNGVGFLGSILGGI